MSLRENLDECIALAEQTNNPILDDLYQLKESQNNKATKLAITQWNQYVKELNSIRGDLDRYEELLNEMQTFINEHDGLEDKQVQLDKAKANFENWQEYVRLQNRVKETQSSAECESLIKQMRDLLESSGRDVDDFDRNIKAIEKEKENPAIRAINVQLENFNDANTIEQQIEALYEIKRLAEVNDIELGIDIEKEIQEAEADYRCHEACLNLQDELRKFGEE